MTKQATLKDIAEAADVSIAAVSLVVNDRYENRVSEETAEKIRKIIEEMHYQPNMGAQIMRGKVSPIIGLIIPNVMNSFYSELTSEIIEEGNRRGYNIILFNSDNGLEQERFAVQTLISIRAAGALVCGVYEPGTKEDKLLQSLSRAGMAVVKFDRVLKGETWSNVAIDNYAASYDSMKYLYRMGHRKIALVTSGWNLEIVKEREKAYRDFVRDYQLPCGEEMIYTTKSFDFVDVKAEQVAEEVLQDMENYSAVFVAAGDLLAIECMNYWKARGVKVPDEISVMGFDNIYISQLVEPKLTTVDQSNTEMGRESVRLLMEQIDGDRARQQLRLKHRIMVRESVKSI